MSQRLRIEIQGIVQGVGFRPFVYRLASRHRLNGWVRNTPQGVLLEVEGHERELLSFSIELEQEAP
ncbi:MAG TPA: acylphosphatase, partial [Geobacteraceae bacterium]